MDQVKNILDQIAEYKGDLTDSYKPHSCSRNFCNPQTLFQLTRFGNDVIYLCKFRQYHICDESHCHCASCPISGICWGTNMYSSYASDDHRTWNVSAEMDDDPVVYVMPGYEVSLQNVVQPAEEVVFTSKLNKMDATGKIEQVLEKLLYSPKRKTINEDYHKQKDKALYRERDAYIVACARDSKPVNRVHLSMIADRHQSNQAPLTILERDDRLVSHLVDCVLQVCETVERYSQQTQSKICVISIALGVLYTMRQGYSLDNVTLIPMSPLLRDHLPIMNHLSKFGLEKQKYTKGHQLIVFAYDNALRQGAELRDLCIRVRDTDLNLKKL